MSETPSADRVSFVTIDEGRDGQRLDNFLITHLKGVPRSRIYRIIRSGEVRVNKKRAKQTTRLANGDIVRIPPIRTAESEAPPKVSDALAERLSRTLIYEDEHLFIFNKPAGLAVHGGSGVSLGLIEALRVLYPEERELELVHRLDRDTSGCIMVARRRSFLRRLQRLMQQGGVEKRYWLLCQGFKGKERRIEAPLLKLMQGNERVVRVSREGKPSVTDFRLLERLGGVSLVEATLGTGRTHQIRVHSQFGGFALLGDDKYGNDQGDRLLG
ncbi:RluA family pseudouridine synthase [Alloalcanivorax xenomutans]